MGQYVYSVNWFGYGFGFYLLNVPISQIKFFIRLQIFGFIKNNIGIKY